MNWLSQFERNFGQKSQCGWVTGWQGCALSRSRSHFIPTKIIRSSRQDDKSLFVGQVVVLLHHHITWTQTRVCLRYEFETGILYGRKVWPLINNEWWLLNFHMSYRNYQGSQQKLGAIVENEIRAIKNCQQLKCFSQFDIIKQKSVSKRFNW